MKKTLLICTFIASFSTAVLAGSSVNVTQHHNNLSRDGLYIDPTITAAAAVNVTRDTNFDGTIVGNVYAQPLYIENGPGGVAMVIAATESNNVYALNAATGAIIWQRNVGTPQGSLGNISPVGITGTPVVDLATRSLFFDAVISGPNNMIYSLNVDTGAINSGWPIDVNATISGFSSSIQSQRAALTVIGSTVYVPYGGYFGDAGTYHGRVVGVQINNPANVGSYATAAAKAGIWGPGGIASDGTDIFVTTGNGSSGAPWSGSEAVIRLQPGPVFSGSTVDFWAPTNWQSLDSSDADLGGSGPIVVDVPGATPSTLVVAIGKDRNAYILNRANLGGVIAPLSQGNVSTSTVINAATSYRTTQGTYVALRPTTGTLTAFRITATNPPTVATGWSVSSSGRTSPFITSSDGLNDMIVWAAGSDGRLRGYNGDTGVTVFSGGGASDVMSGVRSFNTGIAARGRIYYAADNKVYAFNVPSGATPTPSPTATPTPTPTCGPNTLSATLQGSQEVPPNGSTATGSGTVTFDQTQTMITVNLTFNGLSAAASAAHIHAPAGPGATAPVSIGFTGFPNATSGNYSNTFAVTPTQVSQLMSGLGYMNIHNGNFPNGEIRGQLTLCGPTPTPTGTPSPTPTVPPTPTPTSSPSPTPQTPTPVPSCSPGAFSATLQGSQEVPPNGSTATGSATVTLDQTQTMITVSVNFSGLGANASAAHIHAPAAPGSTAPVAIGFTGFPNTTSGTYNNTFPITATQLSQLFSGLGYVNIHNANFPNGEIRGQLSFCGPTPTPTPGVTPTPTPGVTPTPTPSPGVTPTPTGTPGGTITPTPTPGVTPTPTPGGSPARALNISTRLRVETGSNVLIGGFIISGTTSKNVVVRGIGPSLTGVGITDALADPTLELRASDSSLIRVNDNWQDDPAQAALLTGAGLGLQHPNESGIAETLQGGNSYTAIVAGKNDGTGVGLVEIYDISPAADGQSGDAQLANISTRGFVQTGSNVMIGGFILGGSGNTHVAVRGIGPSLAAIGLSPVLADPTLELHDSNGATLVSNNDWQSDPVSASQLEFHGLGLSDAHEAGIYMSLPPGLFTAILFGDSGGTGIGLIEIYNLH